MSVDLRPGTEDRSGIELVSSRHYQTSTRGKMRVIELIHEKYKILYCIKKY